MIHPLFAITIAFCLGIISAASFEIPFLILYLAALLSVISGIVFLRQNTRFNILILCVSFFLGAAVLTNSQILPNCHIARLIPYKAESVFLTGVIDNDPIYQERNVSFILKAEKLGINETWQKTCGQVLIKAFFAEGARLPQGQGLMPGGIRNKFSYGDRLFLKGRLHRPFSFSGGFNYGDYLKHQGIYRILDVKKDSIVKGPGRNAANPLKSLSFRIKHRLREVIIKNLSFFSAGILNAVILGERQNLPVYIRDILVKSGTVHIIAISGLHLAIVAFIILVILKILRIPRKPRYLFTILFLVVYCILTGARPSVVRATIMASVLLLGYFLEREAGIYSSLSVAALLILAVNPWQLFEIGFQLSFLSVFFIVWLPPKIKSIFPEKLNKTPCRRFLISIFSVSFSAWLGLLPLIAYYFRILSPITILANMIIVPYMTVIVASGFSLALIGMLIPSFALIFAASSELFILILFKINSFLISIPGAYFKLPQISLAYVLLYYGLLILVFNLSNLYSLNRLFKK